MRVVDEIMQFAKETDDKIVSLDKRKATQRSKVLVDLLDYWQGLCPEGGLPARADIDPRRIEGALPYAFVLERLTPSTSRLRVAGGHLVDLMGMDVRGMPVSALFQPGDRKKLSSLINSMFLTPRALELELSARGTGSRKSIRAEMMALPLIDDTGSVSRALGCLVAQGALPNPPYRFQIDASRETDIDISKEKVSFAPAPLPKPHLPKSETLHGMDGSRQMAFAEPRADYAAPSKTCSKTTAPAEGSDKAPHLRVIK